MARRMPFDGRGPIMLKDIRYAFRALRQSPGFALTAIVSIALAIGANSAIFSLADGVLLRPLPVRNPSEVVTIRAVAPTLNSSLLAGSGLEISYPDFIDFRDKSQSFSGMFVYRLTGVGFARDPQAQPQIKMGFQVSANFFHVLGVEPE